MRQARHGSAAIVLPVVIDRFWRNDPWCAEFDSASDGSRVVVPDASTVAAHRNDIRAAAMATV
jgi:hypothetical protein